MDLYGRLLPPGAESTESKAKVPGHDRIRFLEGPALQQGGAIFVHSGTEVQWEVGNGKLFMGERIRGPGTGAE
jgi:hypothetical protein